MILASLWNPIDWIRNGIGLLTDAVGAAADSLLGDIFEWIASLLLRGVMWLFDVVYDFVSSGTTPDLQAAWFANGPLGIAQQLGAWLLMVFVVLAIAETVWNRDGGHLLRTMGQDVPKVVVLMLWLVGLTQLGLVLADGVSSWVMGQFGENVEVFTLKLSKVASVTGFGAGIMVIVAMAAFLMLVLLFVTVELVFRESFILILVPTCAVLLATEVYRPTKGMGARTTRLLTIAIASKPFIALCLAVGASAMGQQAESTDDPVAVAEPGAGPQTISQEDFDAWVTREMPECINGGPLIEQRGDYTYQIVAQAVLGSPAAGQYSGACREVLEAGWCCDQMQWSGPAVLVAGTWRETTVTSQGGESIDDVDTAAVAPTFGLMLAGLASMLLAAFAPFLLMRLISTDPAATASGDGRKQLQSSATQGSQRVGSIARKVLK